MITIYKTGTMKEGAYFVMDALKRVDKSNLGITHTIIVPDRASMETERLLLKMVGGSFNIQVLTFRRLASRILPNYDYLSKQAGIMALSGIIQDNKDKLTCYKRGILTPGFVADMYDTISMMKYCKISPQNLTKDNVPRGVKAKASDIALLYQEYLDYTKDRFVDSADKLDLLCECLGEQAVVKNGYFYVLDFDNFSTQEFALVEKLMLTSLGVTVACCVSEKPQDKHLYLNDIYQGLLEICQRNVITPNIIENNKPDENKLTRQIGQNLYRYNDAAPVEACGNVTLFQGETRTREVYSLACQIQKYVRQGGRFKDVYVVTSDVNKYANAISSVFDELEIPYFCDKQYCLADQPYATFVLDYLTLYRNKGKLQSVLAFVKNYLFCGNFKHNDDETDVFKFENYCLKYNVSYRYDAFNLGKDEAYFENANNFRQKFNDLYKAIVIPNVASATAFVELIKQLLERCDVKNKNELFAKRQQELGYSAESKATSQAFEKFDEVLEQAVQIVGNRVLSLDDFIKTLSSAVSSVQISVLPVNNDCVVFANMAKARKHDIKFLALLGANYGAMPIVKGDCKLLSDNNIKDLVSAGINVEPQIFTENKRERFSLFQLLQEPTDKLYVSFAGTEGADSLSPSPFVQELCKLFVCKGKPLCVGVEEDEEIYTTKQAITKVILNNRCVVDRQLVKMPSYNILKEHFKEQTEKYQFEKEYNVNVSNGEGLFFKSARTSVSQLTDFFKCPYKFFIEYGLNVKPREVAELKSADLGTILHDVMEHYVANIQTDEKDEITKQKANECFDNALSSDFYKGLRTDSQMQGTLEQLRAEAQKMCCVIKKQLATSRFTNLKTELAFGTEGAECPPVEVDYGGGKFNLVGKIDRVDGYNDHIIIIDYKSGAAASRYSEKDLYIGQKMQLLVYLKAAQDYYNKRPAGFYYFNMHNNFTDISNDKVYTYNGRTLADVDIACALDTSLANGGTSEKLGLRILEKGALDGRIKKTLTASQFDNQVEYAIELIKSAGKLMKQGYCSISPYEKACDFCDYKHICDFGDVFNHNQRKVTQQVTPSTIDLTVFNKKVENE